MQQQGVFLLNIGDELLDGRTVNTNASYFGEQLRLAGIPVVEVRSVSDKLDDIVVALHDSLACPVVIVTGGLGPTNDDRTAEAIARTFRRPLGFTKESVKHVRDRYRLIKRPLNAARLRIAKLPRGVKMLKNPKGSAPGFSFRERFQCDDHFHTTEFFVLPGVPTECRPMLDMHVMKRAAAILGVKRKLVRREVWRCFGLGESDFYERVSRFVAPLEKKYPSGFTFGVHIAFPGTDLTLEIWEEKGKKSPQRTEVASLVKKIDQALGEYCFARERISLPEVMVRELKKRRLTLATAESCTGGLVGKLLTDISGSSSVYQGGAITYSNDLKRSLVGVKAATLRRHGAVSRATAEEMAEGARLRFNADFSIALSGVSGPGGGTKEKPVGLICVAVSGPDGKIVSHERVIAGGQFSREQNRLYSAYLALDLLRRQLG